jgi:hypothetical protein
MSRPRRIRRRKTYRSPDHDERSRPLGSAVFPAARTAPIPRAGWPSRFSVSQPRHPLPHYCGEPASSAFDSSTCFMAVLEHMAERLQDALSTKRATGALLFRTTCRCPANGEGAAVTAWVRTDSSLYQYAKLLAEWDHCYATRPTNKRPMRRTERISPMDEAPTAGSGTSVRLRLSRFRICR